MTSIEPLNAPPAAEQVPQKSTRRDCSLCPQQDFCIPDPLAADAGAKSECANHAVRKLRKGERLHYQSDPFRNIHAVREGVLKAYKVSVVGEETVVRFYYPGDIVGIESIGQTHLDCSVVALTPSVLCVFPFESLNTARPRDAAVMKYLFEKMSQEIVQRQNFITQLSKFSAERRLACFIAELAEKPLPHKAWPRLTLPMNRSDMANYLGIAVETASRIIHQLETAGAIRVRNRSIDIVDQGALNALAGRQCQLQ